MRYWMGIVSGGVAVLLMVTEYGLRWSVGREEKEREGLGGEDCNSIGIALVL